MWRIGFHYFAFQFSYRVLAFQYLVFPFVLWRLVDILPYLFVGTFLAFPDQKTNDSLILFWLGLQVFGFLPMVRETWVQSQFAYYQRLLKWYLIPPCLTLSNMKYISRVKWSNQGKRVAPSPKSRCSSYWKGNLLVAFDYGHQLYLLISSVIPSNLLGISHPVVTIFALLFAVFVHYHFSPPLSLSLHGQDLLFYFHIAIAVTGWFLPFFLVYLLSPCIDASRESSLVAHPLPLSFLGI